MTHNVYLIEAYTTPETRAAFAELTEDQINQWITDAIEELDASGNTPEDQNRYIGKVALAHNFWEKNQT